KAKKLAETPQLQAMIYHNLADVTLEQHTDSALYYYHKSLWLYASGMEDGDDEVPTLALMKSSPNKRALLASLLSISDYWWQVWRQEKDAVGLKKNLHYLELADQLMEVLFHESAEHESKLFWRKQAANVYGKAVRACYEGNHVKKAYHFMERNKGFLLMVNLSKRQAQQEAMIPLWLIEKERKWQQELSTLQAVLYDQQSQPSDEMEDSLYQKTFRYHSLLDSLKEAYPRYKKYLESINLISFEGHQERLPKECVSVHYLISSAGCYGLAISAQDTKLFPIDGERLTKMLNRYKGLSDHPLATEKQLTDYATLSYQLFQLLLKDPGVLDNHPKRIWIAADGRVQNLNFEALNTRPEARHVRTSYLIYTFEISYVYSFSYQKENKRLTRSHKGKMAAFTPGVFQKDALSPLPNSVNEGRQIAEMVHARHYQGLESSKKRLLKTLADHQLIHIATHAVIDEQLLPSLYMNDDDLSLSEVYTTDSPADLIVLSACGTSEGRQADGEGVMSLARAFIYAGARAVISTIGNINDGFSTKIMIPFYRYLKEGRSAHHSLRQAKLDYLPAAEGSAISPYYWAGFIYIGGEEPHANTYLIVWVGLAVGLLITIFLLLWRKKMTPD
ncbi:MAG: CHAT domain-containing protein, partial [Bacteroidota bacterium]